MNEKNSAIAVRAAQPSDVQAIHDLLLIYSRQRIVLERSVADIQHYLGNFLVAEMEGKFAGCVAVRDFGNHLLEVRSLAVVPELVGSGVGRALVEYAVEKQKKTHEHFRLFALTLQPEFFKRLGFEVVGKELFPEKIWSDCLNCPKKECCDEYAVMYNGD